MMNDRIVIAASSRYSGHHQRQRRPHQRARFFRLRARDQWSQKDISDKHIERLPTSAASYYEQQEEDEGTTGGGRRGGFEILSWETVRTVLLGTRSDDDSCPLRRLREFESTVVRDIFTRYLCIPPEAHGVRLTIPAPFLGRIDSDDNVAGEEVMRFTRGRGERHWHTRDTFSIESATAPPTTMMPTPAISSSLVSYAVCGEVNFPPPADRNVNMMPFILGFKDSLPLDLQCYHELVEACPYENDEVGKVCYLTVHESYVEAGQTQRRLGLHIESPVTSLDSDNGNAASFTAAGEHSWGMGVCWGEDLYHGGIFMASNVAGTTRIWDALVDKGSPCGLVDHHGGCEHLRPWLGGPGTLLRANEVVWTTDCTPHEALPMEAAGYRQFFRLVSPYVSTWYADHSTSNPNVPVPDHVRVVHGSKFTKPIGDVPSGSGHHGGM